MPGQVRCRAFHLRHPLEQAQVNADAVPVVALLQGCTQGLATWGSPSTEWPCTSHRCAVKGLP